MRVVRLDMERYGHVSGQSLEFPPDRGLHVVMGANEAGKSTALEALADGLFGFSIRDSRRFAHPDDPRVGFSLCAADGTVASFIRRKAGKDKLLGADGVPVPEVALARFLGGVSRKRFREVFGLDGERLRQGGRTILLEHGEAGAAVLQAQTGLRGLREAVGRLDEEARTLFGDGRGVRRISKAATAVKDNRRLMAERSLSGADHARATEGAAALSARMDVLLREMAALRAEQARLERTRRTAPVRGALAQAVLEQGALGPMPDLPADAAARRDEAQTALDQAGRDLARDQHQATAVQEALDQLRPDPAVLAEAAAITTMADDRSRIMGVRRDRLRVVATAAEWLRDLNDTAERLQVIERGPALRGRLPDAATRRSAERLLKQQAERLGARTLAADAVRQAELALQEAGRVRDGLTAPESADALRDAVEAANREGAIDAALAEAEAQHGTAAADLSAALAGLALWTGDEASLAASPVPLEAEALRLGLALGAAGQGLEAATAALAGHERAIEACQASLAGLQRAGVVPTAAAIAAVRGQRDTVWRQVRRRYEEGGPASDDLPDQLDRLLHEADALADRRTTEAVRVAEWERLQAEEGLLLARRHGMVAAQGSTLATLEHAQAAWRTAWLPAAVQPLDPVAMRDWVRAREAVLRAARTAREAAQKVDALRARHGLVAGLLRGAIPETETGMEVAALRQVAARRLKRLDDAALAHADAVAAATRAAARLATERMRLAGIDDAAGQWRAAWVAVAGRLGLAADAEVDDASEALRLWTVLEGQLNGWSGDEARVREMDATLADHAADLAILAERLGVAVEDGLLDDLAARLGAAQQAQTEQRRLLRQRAGLIEAVAGHRHMADEAEAVLMGLRRQAGASDDATLAEAIGRAMKHAVLTAVLRERTAELHKLDDGKTEAELASEAAGTEFDGIPGRLAEIGATLVEQEAERTEIAARRADLRATLQRMETGQDVAGPAQEVQDALADIEDSAHRYVRLRMAHALLQGGIERFRRSQQGPLLAEASGLFEELTAGHYHRLEQDEGDKGEAIIVAVRPDGTMCPADLLSEGTRDQLFLALRLASIKLDAAASEPLPFIADDLLVNFDDNRATAALRLLAQFGAVTQVILFTHHDHLVDLVDPGRASIHRLPRELAVA